MPFLQARFAAENRLAAMFELAHYADSFDGALAFLVALFFTLALACRYTC